MKVSEIKAENIANYLRITEVDKSLKEDLSTFLEIAINYVENYTGIQRKKEDANQLESLDNYNDLIIAIYILCQDMYDNRTMYIDKNYKNDTVKTILDMHTRNNL